jgi:hypothetical protein
MDRSDQQITRIIEPEDSRVGTGRRPRFGLSSRRALHYNDHPDAIMADFDRGDYGTVLREVERHLLEWERERTPEQAKWVTQARRRNHRSTITAVQEIVEAVRRA